MTNGAVSPSEAHETNGDKSPTNRKKADDILSDVSESEGNYYDALSEDEKNMKEKSDTEQIADDFDLLKEFNCSETTNDDGVEKPSSAEQSVIDGAEAASVHEMDLEKLMDSALSDENLTSANDEVDKAIDSLVDALVPEKTIDGKTTETENVMDTNTAVESEAGNQSTNEETNQIEGADDILSDDEDMLLRSPSRTEIMTEMPSLSESALLADTIFDSPKVDDNREIPSEIAEEEPNKASTETVEEMEVDDNQCKSQNGDEKATDEVVSEEKLESNAVVVKDENPFDLFDNLKDDAQTSYPVKPITEIKEEKKDIVKVKEEEEMIKAENVADLEPESKPVDLDIDMKTESEADNEVVKNEGEIHITDIKETDESQDKEQTEAKDDAEPTDEAADLNSVDNENKDNNLLEAMTSSPRSNCNSYEESMSSFRDDMESNADIESKDENSSDNNQNEKAEKTKEVNTQSESDNCIDPLNEIPLAEISQQDSSVSLDEASNSNDVSQRSLNNSKPVSNEEADVISLDDDDDDDLVRNDETAANEKSESKSSVETTDDISTSEKRRSDPAQIDEQPPAKKARTEPIESDAAKTDETPSTPSVEESTSTNDEKADDRSEGEGDLVVDLDCGEDIEMAATPEPQSTVENQEENTADKPTEPANEVVVAASESNLSEPMEVTTAKDDKVVQSSAEANETIAKSLTPQPEKMPPRKLALDFMQRFKKNFSQMTRKDLEELVMEKIVEAVVHKSEYSELKQKSEQQEQKIGMMRQKIQEITKQYRDLDMVHSRVQKDLESRIQNTVTPIKITRAVGLQVALQKSIVKETPAPVLTPLLAKPSQRPAPSTSNQANQASQAKAVILQNQHTQRLLRQQQQQQLQAQAQQKAKQIHQPAITQQQRIVVDMADVQSPMQRRLSTMQMSK